MANHGFAIRHATYGVLADVELTVSRSRLREEIVVLADKDDPELYKYAENHVD